MITEESLFYRTGRVAGFTAGFALFASVLYAVLSFQQKVPAGTGYAHFLLAAVLLSAAVLFFRRYAV
jgi:hypothetical protein